MLIFDEFDDRFYIDEDKTACAQRFIAKDEIININGIAVRNNSIADLCSEYTNNFKFATFYSVSKRDYEYYIIALGFAAFVGKTDFQEKANVSLEYDRLGNIIFRFIKDVQIGEKILYKEAE